MPALQAYNLPSPTAATLAVLPQDLGTSCALYREALLQSACLTSPNAPALMPLPPFREPALLVYPPVALALPLLHSPYHYQTDTGRWACHSKQETEALRKRRGGKPEPGSPRGRIWSSTLPRRRDTDSRQVNRNKTAITQGHSQRSGLRGRGSQGCDEGM